MELKSSVKAFNTGRTYSDHGQRIAWAKVDEGRFVFYDIDRHISGSIEIEEYEDCFGDIQYADNDAILGAYDTGHYKNDVSYRDGEDLLRPTAEALPTITVK